MSSTTGVQNLLVNVFRPVYTYDATTTLFTPKLELSNIDNYSGNTVSVFTAAVGDGSNNVYVGSNAGNPYTTIKSCQNVTALGFGAGSNISNVLNSTYIGYNAGVGASNATNVVAVGANTFGAGISNVFLGAFAGSTGNSNIFIGTSAQGTTGSNNIVIGPGISIGSSNNQFRVGSNYLYGRLDTKWLGIGTPVPSDTNTKLDVSGNLYVKGQEGINMVPIRTLDVNGNFRASDSNGTLDFSNGVTTCSNGFASIRGSLSLSAGGDDEIIGPIKKGMILISALDSGNSSNRASAVYFAYDSNLVYSMSVYSNSSDFRTNTSNTNLKLDWNGSSNIVANYSITYFPLP